MLEAIAWSSLLVGAAVLVVSLVVLYFVIYLAVRHALRSHAEWVAEDAATSRNPASWDRYRD